ncbi:hypothetical protein GJ631_04615 [Natronomonas sp. CBA1123]|uniref:DUF5658 family protein n=1 Tax=Natronomonas sp. CBA1123 TaxID=2668070 RepID=UPI001305E357|nr:DUF5658 family protein [Natronomonas sp. CBA1123]MUV85872.1 hypothetical protein [Natronomonas sp. CBA1123]
MSADTPARSPFELLAGAERPLWVAAVLLYGIGDTATTFWGLSVGGAAEAGPVAGPFIHAYGPVALLGLKAVVFTLFYLVWRVLRTPGRTAVPLALAVVGGLVTTWNLLVLSGTL